MFKLPVPRIPAWSSEASKIPVEAEYIIEERAPGVRLGSLWNQRSQDTKLKLVAQVAEMENSLTTITFPKHGCIYFKEDLDFLTGNTEDLDIDLADTEALKRLSIVPLTAAELWTDTRRDMELDRGPCE